MDIAVLLFLTSGLFLGWALGANHLANVFGTAIGTRMLSWTTGALTCGVFIVLGSVISGAGPSATLSRLGTINAAGGAFMVALSAGIVMFWMTRLGLPVPTTQAIVGSIIGWNFFAAALTDGVTLTQIIAAWIAGPLIAAGFAIGLLKLVSRTKKHFHPHLIRADAYTRVGLLLAGAFGAYSLGANNIANVMGVFVPVSPFTTFSIGGLVTLSSVQQLFLIGSLAIFVGVLTYSHRVIRTVGSELLDMSPLAAWIVVMAHSLVLFMFSSERLEHLLANLGLPTLPLVPLSSSVVVVGAVIGIGLQHSGRRVSWRSLGRIGLGWLVTPFLSGAICFVGLFVLQNLFHITVYREVRFAVTPAVETRMADMGLPVQAFADLKGRTFHSAIGFRDALRHDAPLAGDAERRVMRLAEITPVYFDPQKTKAFAISWLTPDQVAAVRDLAGRRFESKWAVAEALARATPDWRMLADTTANRMHNKEIAEGLNLVYRTFAAPGPAATVPQCGCPPAGGGSAAGKE